MSGRGRRPSVIIAARNEEAVIGRCLDALLADSGPHGIDITVVANGCKDRTAAVAASRAGVRVIDRPEPGKSGALNAGDAAAEGFPRIYLDADVELSPGAVHVLSDALEPSASREGTAAVSPPLAVVPRRQLDLTNRPLLVRAFFAINSRLPAYDGALYGRGAIALSARGRARFAEFPDIIADDLYLDSLFAGSEKREVTGATSIVSTPQRTADLVRRLARVRAGNAAMRATARRVADGRTTDGSVDAAVRPAARTSWLRHVVLPRPWLAPAAAGYVVITIAAAVLARRRREHTGWSPDDSTRQASPHQAPTR
jgi:glycosyltransferase involved in cell wall biosynthesis